jgi:hypothetical protein
MGGFDQFGGNPFKQSQTHFGQLNIYLDPDELKLSVYFNHFNA